MQLFRRNWSNIAFEDLNVEAKVLPERLEIVNSPKIGPLAHYCPLFRRMTKKIKMDVREVTMVLQPDLVHHN